MTQATALSDNPLALAGWDTLSAEQLLSALNNYLQSRIPGSHLKLQSLPLAPEISLWLINDDYPRNGLEPEQVEALMDHPPYWGFCWGSGQALARWLIDNPGSVAGKVLVDFGCGSGVAGIAAKMAGAHRVVLCDLDEKALAASRLNALHNGVELEYASSLEKALHSLPELSRRVVTVADVFYDRENLPLLPMLQKNFQSVLVADSRLKGQPLESMEIFSAMESHTVPDLEESAEFNRITLYRTAAKDCIPLR